jgi:transaldolase
MSALEQLKRYTKVVADTGDFASMKKFKPVDATTNPSLILAASNMDAYKGIVNKAVAFGKSVNGSIEERLKKLLTKCLSCLEWKFSRLSLAESQLRLTPD